MSFGRRILKVWAKEPAKGGVLQNARVRWLGRRAFLVGQPVDYGRGVNSDGGADIWFPVDDIVMLAEYADLHSARNAYAAHKKKHSDDEVSEFDAKSVSVEADSAHGA